MKAHSVILSALAAMWFLSSCSSSKQIGQRSYEDDEVYYQRGETFITEVPEPVPATSNAEVPDDYYTPGQGGDVTNNYYGDTYINDGWNNSFNTWHNRSRWVMAWDPMFGWHLTYNFGWNNCGWANNPWGAGGWDNGWNNGWNNWGWNNGWNNWGGYQNWNNWNGRFWGDPFCANMPFYNLGYFWNGQGYGFNGMGGAWAWGDDSMNNQVTFGHRSPIAANSYFSSSYDHNTIYHDRVKKPILQQGEGGVPSEVVDRKPNLDEQPFVSRFPYVEPPRPSGNTVDRDARRPGGNDDYFTPRPGGAGDTERRPDRVEPPRPNDPPAERKPSSPPSGGGERDRGGRDGDRNSGSGFSNPSQGSGRTSPSPGSPSRSSGGSSRRR